MKNKTLSLITIAVLAASTIAFMACKKECSNCVVPPPDVTEQILFDLTGKTLQTEFDVYKMPGNKYREIVTRKESHENLFTLLKDYCTGEDISMNNQAFAFVLYYDVPVCQSNKVTDEHIKGVSVYQVEKNKNKHHLFVRDENSKFNEIKNAYVSVPAVSHNHCHFYLENYVFSDPQNKSYIIVMGDYAKKVKINYNTPLRFEVKNMTKAPSRPTDFYTCGYPCPLGDGGCLEEQGQIPRCVTGGVCSSSEIQIALQAKNMVESMFIDLDLMYAFRDDFLYKSEKGEAYIDNYYYLSEEYQKKVSIPLALQTALFFRDFNPVMEAFINPESHLSETMFTDKLSNSLLKLLDEYEKITDSEEGKAILASVRADINAFRNKPLKDILAMI
jgi:hypothetical protein